MAIKFTRSDDLDKMFEEFARIGKDWKERQLTIKHNATSNLLL